MIHKKKLNIVTLPDKKRFLSLNPKYFIKSLISLFKKYHGHAAVTESLIKGLKINNYNFSYNNYDEFHEICWVLSGIDTLEYFLSHKNYNKLIVGPNVVNMPYDKEYLINHKFVDLIIVPSKWVETAYKKYTNKNIFKWYAGVDKYAHSLQSLLLPPFLPLLFGLLVSVRASWFSSIQFTRNAITGIAGVV